MFFLFEFPFFLQSTHARRPTDDDVDAQERLPGLLNDSYYRNVLCEFGTFFAIANRIDVVHKNPWIGFQPWRASSRNVCKSLVETCKLDRHPFYNLNALVIS